ncbi:MAG: EAL domain-containing protein [Acholeplasmatales bacterium]|nr:EAL domain-containing protein [Acholeplasmatales bacterium]
MFDFKSLIDALKSGSDPFRCALDLVKDELHIGKIVIKSDAFPDTLEYISTEEYDKDNPIKYENGSYDFTFFKNDKNYELTDEEKNDIDVLLRILELYYNNFILRRQAEERETLSSDTNMPNAKGFFKQIHILLNSHKPSEYNSYYINLKGFGFVNRLYNYQIGDQLIKEYAKKVKEFTSSDSAIGHLGGDNFVAFLKKEKHKEFVNAVSKVNVELEVDGNKTKIEIKGVIGYQENSDKDFDYRSVIANTAIACQYAKIAKKPIEKLTPALLEMFISINNIEHTFKDELEMGNFSVYYQPKFDINTGKIIGVEALSRWKNKGKVLPPSVFVPILEKNGDIIQLDLFVLESLCKDIHNYRNLGNNIVPASCNLSRKDFEDEELEDKIINIIRKYNVKTEDIVIEVTETTNLEENERLARFINKMWQNGIMTSIDDFGTGYSSLSVLRDFKVNEIKIDRTFINRNMMSESDEIIISSIIAMAKKLNISVICEGVETKEQADFLAKYGCFRAQGYYYSKPVPKLEFEDMLKKIGTYHD